MSPVLRRKQTTPRKVPESHCHDCGTNWPIQSTKPPQKPAHPALCPMCGLAPDGCDPLIGQTLGHNQILQRVKGGLLNVVYQAHDRERNLSVALKLLHPQALQSLGGLPLVRRLLHRWRQFHHPSAPRLLHIFETDTQALCWTSPWLSGTPISTQIQPPHEALSPQHIRAIIDQLCDVLQSMHEQGLVHGQLRPEQIFLQSQSSGFRLLLSDLGWGASIGEHFLERQHKDEGTMRAMRFLAPEQWLSEIKTVTPHADIYATAALLFQLMTRRPPFPGRHWEDLYRAHIYAPPPRLNMACPSLHFDDALEELMRCALAKQPQDRFPSIHSFRQAFHAIDLQAAIHHRRSNTATTPRSTPPLAAPWLAIQKATQESPQKHTLAAPPQSAPMFLGRKGPAIWKFIGGIFLFACICALLWYTSQP